jgi:hypothetical protein
MNQNIKEKLLDFCLKNIAEKLQWAQQRIAESQQSANEETKSSAGDKYETGRAMMQIEIEKYMRQMAEYQKQMQALQAIQLQAEYTIALAGSLVQTSRGNYFLSVGLGKISVEGQDFWAISPTSPIGELMYKKTVGHQFSFNGTKFAIEYIL